MGICNLTKERDTSNHKYELHSNYLSPLLIPCMSPPLIEFFFVTIFRETKLDVSQIEIQNNSLI